MPFSSSTPYEGIVVLAKDRGVQAVINAHYGTAADSTNLYFGNGRSIERAAFDDWVGTPIACGSSAVRRIAVDDAHAYWADQTNLLRWPK